MRWAIRLGGWSAGGLLSVLSTHAAALAAPQSSPPAGPSTPPAGPPPFRLFRYDEDFSSFADPALRTGPLDQLKFIPIAEDPTVWLSFGGEARTRYEYTSAPAFGLRGPGHDDYLLQRLLLHADLRIGDRSSFHVRTFVQLVSGFVVDPEFPKPGSQDNALDLQQGSAEAIWGDDRAPALAAGGTAFSIRAGRQEMGLGSYRLVTSREPTNARLTFDGARAVLRTGGTRIDAFVVRPVLQKVGVFNDEADDDTLFWGVYSSTPLAPEERLAIDIYYLGLDRDMTRYQSGIGDELRHSIGARLWGRADGWDHDTEAVFQFGTFDQAGRDQDILAWTIASNTGYTFREAAWTPRVGVKVNVASGDEDPNDDRLGTFNPLFPRNNYFNDANLLAPYNFFDVHPSLQVKPTKDVSVSLGWDAFFRYSTDDAVFSPTGIVIPAGASSERFVGSAISVGAEWSMHRHATLSASYVHFFAGDVVEDAGGKDVDFFGAWLTFKF